MQGEAEKAREGFEKAGEKLRSETDAMTDASDMIAVNTGEMAARIRLEAEELLARTGAALSELKLTGDSFAIRAREVAEQMKASRETAENYGRDLKAQATSVADVSAQSAEILGKAVSVLTSKMEDVSKAAGEATVRVEKAGERLAGESERFVYVSSAALEAAKDASNTFSRQSESLYKASQDASRFIGEIEETGFRAERDAFMSSAKFIVESLYSLSVDVSRLMEGDVSEKSWKAYQKGDVSAFTRRLLALGEEWPIDKARDKFGRDAEFRTFVQRYIRQFEEMYEQAAGNDHGALLSTTIGSSEVARLYQFLCQVSGRDSRLGKDIYRAA